MKIFIEHIEEIQIILCNKNDDECIAREITMNNTEKFVKENFEYWGHNETNSLVKASVYRPIKNDEKLWIDKTNDKVCKLQGVVMDVHNRIVENTYRFRYIGKLIDEE